MKRGRSKTIPVQTSFTDAVATVAEIVPTVLAYRAVVVEIVRDVRFSTTVTGYEGIDVRVGRYS